MVERRREFEHELEAIEAKVIELFAMVAEDLPGATQALLTGNNDVLETLTEREQLINALYPEIEELVNREILLQAPVASDLRFLLSVLRIVPELERSHDLVVQIASRANHILGEDLSPRSRGIVERMGTLASEMWRQAVDSWYQRDRSVALALEERDDEMDELHASLIAELASGRMALPVTMEMTLVARFYERLADHSVNIARRVIYLAGTQAPRSLVVKVTAGKDDAERCNQAFTVAATAVASGVRTSLWLTGESSWFALPGRAGEFSIQDSPPLADLLAAVLAAGTVTLCSQCASRRDIKPGDVL